MLVGTQNDRPDRIPLEVESHTIGIARELDHFSLHDVGKSVNPDDAVSEADNGSLAPGLDAEIETLDTSLDEITDFRWIQLHNSFLALIPEFLGKAFDLPPHRCVNHSITRTDEYTADQVRIDLDLDFGGFAQ